MATYGHWAQKRSFLVGSVPLEIKITASSGNAWGTAAHGSQTACSNSSLSNPRKWIRDLQGRLDPTLKASLQSSADAGMIKKKTVTVKVDAVVKSKTVVLEAQSSKSTCIY